MVKEKLTLKDYVLSLGPGAIMAANIIGPGTVTSASVSGSKFGYQAMWLVMLSCFMAYFYQELGTRLSLSKGVNIYTAFRVTMGKKTSEFLWFVIYFGSIAFLAGNISGSNMALTYIFQGTNYLMWSVVVLLIAFAIAWINRYGVVEKINEVLVVLMVIAFFATAIACKPNVGDIFSTGFSFKIPGNDYWSATALLATTAVPNLIFGYTAFMATKYPHCENLDRQIKLSNFGLGFNMVVTFLITAAIVICSGAVLYPRGVEVKSAGDMAQQLAPLLGNFAGILFAFGLFGAAISSTLFHFTAHPRMFPAAFGLDENPAAFHNRAVTIPLVLLPFIFIVIWGSTPVSVLMTAQAVNGIAMPIVFFFCWRLGRNKEYMGKYANKTWQNVIFVAMTLLSLLFAVNTFRSLILKIIAMAAA